MKKYILALIVIACPLFANALPLHFKDSYEANELNRNNTFEGSPRVIFTYQDQKFSLGFYITVFDEDPSTAYPFLALTAWTPEGWMVVAKMNPIINDDLGMYTGTEEEDIYTYLWYIGQTFDGPMLDYLRVNGGGDNDVIVGDTLRMWEKILNKLTGVQVIEEHIVFPL